MSDPRAFLTAGNFTREAFCEWKAAAALEQMAREVQALRIGSISPTIGILDEQARMLAARIRELEAERNKCGAENCEVWCEQRDHILRAEAARDTAHGNAAMWKEAALGKANVAAIRANTIEDTAQIADKWGAVGMVIAQEIRALNQPG